MPFRVFLAEEAASHADSLAAMLIVLGVVLMGVLMVLSIRTKIARRQAQRPTPRELIEQIRNHGEETQDPQAATAQFLDSSQSIMAQLDFKAERLEQLIADADRRIAQMESMQGHSGSTVEPKSPGAPARNSNNASQRSESRSPVDPLAQCVYELSDGGRSPVEIAQQLDEQIGKVELILALRPGR